MDLPDIVKLGNEMKKNFGLPDWHKQISEIAFQYKPFFNTPIFDLIKQQNEIHSKLKIKQFDYFDSLAKSISTQNRFLEPYKILQNSAFLSISSLLANDFGKLLGVSANFNYAFDSKLKKLFESYNNLCIDNDKKIKNSDFHLLEELPTVSVYNAASFVKSIKNIEPDEIINEEKELSEHYSKNAVSNIDLIFKELDNDLQKLWLETKSAYFGNYLGNERHCMFCMRELFTQLIHRFAPDEQILTWTSESKYFDKGKPTRRARIDFIYRNLNNNFMLEFIKSDIDFTLKINDFLQKAHSTEIPLNKIHKKNIFIKFVSSISMIIEIYIADINLS